MNQSKSKVIGECKVCGSPVTNLPGDSTTRTHRDGCPMTPLSQPTPGPWTRDSEHSSLTPAIVTTDGRLVAVVHHASRADVALMTAAPEMLAALSAMIYASDQCRGHRDCGHSMEPWQTARALLARIEGKETAHG